VLINAVAPGYVNTAMSVVDGENELESDWFREMYVDGWAVTDRARREPNEIAALIAWLVSPQNTSVTGSTLIADGGLTVTV
jgi:NAD(P)-dependent dehydrogenase (short-subunit alcohol dehydrogenase family)